MTRLMNPMASTSSLSDVSSESSFTTSSHSHRVKYRGAGDDWDYVLDSEHEPIDVSLILPHYRAQKQPLDHRMNCFVTNYDAPIQIKVCRPLMSQRCAFYLEVLATSSNVTVWLPSDFRGRIHLRPTSSQSKITLSPGFSNHVMKNVQLIVDSEVLEGADWDLDGKDEVDIRTSGNVNFKIWDVMTSSPEVKTRETLKRFFGSRSKKPTQRFNWDFLLDD